MNDPLFNADQRDQFGEIVNIAMGKTGAALAKALDGFIKLRVPEIRAVDGADIGETRKRLILAYERVSILHQQFVGELAGDIAVIYGSASDAASDAALREVPGCDDRDGAGRRQREELLLELSNWLASTFVLDISSTLEMRMVMRSPRVAAFDVPAREGVEHLFRDMPAGAGKSLLINILFHLEDHALPFELMITLLPHCLPGVRRALVSPE